jgi:hypothetical protein
MKKFLTALVMTLTLQAFAGEIAIFDASTSSIGSISSVSEEFGINSELGRAWVVLHFSPDYSDGPVFYDQRVKVPGLRLADDKKSIVLDVDGQQVVCANVKKNILGTFVKATKNCKFKTSFYNVQRDNGYEVETIERLKVTLSF